MSVQTDITTKNTPTDEMTIVLETSVTAEMFQQLRKELKQSMSEFGRTLKRAVNPRAKRPYSRQYVDRLEKGKDVITPKLVAAFYNIATKLDEVPAGTGGAVAVNVIAQPGQVVEGAFIPRSAKTMRCARPGCAVQFIKTHPSQKYHDPECK